MLLLAEVELKYGTQARFAAALERLVPIMEAQGWKLVGSYTDVVGVLGRVLDIWDVADAQAVYDGMAGAASHPDWAALEPELAEIVVRETTNLVAKAPWSLGPGL